MVNVEWRMLNACRLRLFTFAEGGGAATKSGLVWKQVLHLQVDDVETDDEESSRGDAEIAEV
jgi:hypothetical protein